jgi:hypothetical protein
MTNLSDEKRLPRKQASAWLTDRGFPTAVATLETKASRGGGPEYEMFGRIAIYRPSKLLEWAQGRVSAPRPRSAVKSQVAA